VAGAECSLGTAMVIVLKVFKCCTFKDSRNLRGNVDERSEVVTVMLMKIQVVLDVNTAKSRKI
jgi:hypothetical protein